MEKEENGRKTDVKMGVKIGVKTGGRFSALTPVIAVSSEDHADLVSRLSACSRLLREDLISQK